MPQRTISESTPVARKNYGCDACNWISEGMPDVLEGLSYSEIRAIVKARNNGWRIMKGQKHLQATIVSCDGDLVSWRAIPAIHDICMEHDIYDYDDVC